MKNSIHIKLKIYYVLDNLMTLLNVLNIKSLK